eukprot:CAMPEP_0183717520 /NCGR_PEP_ID=MMETSP0737-20130205/11118_1 /TAXON_ID=385413 /ORGANISM="Thalassiosira miniscula, Strain CCMP1093" /LENGTH=723 /DNA_ID=CAMNT_0025946983 /DNA_START=1 /DNA_END=2172 /DNA_ORIENTATION=-
MKAIRQDMEELFLTMHYRKMQRDLHGPQKKKTKFHFIAMACLFLLAYGLTAGSQSFDSVSIVLTLNQIILVGVWVFIVFLVTAIFGASEFIITLYWMLVYWPLLTLLASLIVSGTKEMEMWLLIICIILEVVTFLAFVIIYYGYPRLVTSKWFRETYGATRFWRIKLLDDGVTMQYDGMWGRLSKRYECRYVGETNEGGLPHGTGVWSDNHYDGEILSGTWEEGQPVAPFSSRQYGNGDSFAAVRLAFFKANDDPFEENKLFPTNEEPPKVGVVSVECSVAGNFMAHLPNASMLGEPHVERTLTLGNATDMHAPLLGDSQQHEGERGATIGSVCKKLDFGSQSTFEDQITTSLQINANDPRGVQIGGHLYGMTGMPFTKRIDQIIVDVKRSDTEGEYEALEDGDSERSSAGQKLYLEVKNWKRIGTKDALIFIPGFNSWLKHSCETFGQMMAMTTLSKTVYPILFAWPGAQVMTYRQASIISASENNRNYFLQMLKSLRAEGFFNIHIVTHSLGVQTLMSCFENNEDGSPSPVSDCFGPAPTSTDGTSSLTQVGKLVCRSITLLNPDYPVDAFREHGFQSLRRVTSQITIVGDKADQALFWSSLINGIVNYFGWSQPSALDSEARRSEKGFQLQAPIGKGIDCMYTEDGDDPDDWLDCDCIDTTGLDTNVNDLRHSAYTVNSILLRDIEEIVVTGKRAATRTTLLHKKGNVYEYCHAPSFVSQ